MPYGRDRRTARTESLPVLGFSALTPMATAAPSIFKVAPHGGRTWQGLESVRPGDQRASSVAAMRPAGR